MASKSLNRNLSAAKAAKQDEFYTQYVDIQKEVEAYLEYNPNTFRNKVVYCNCDDPFESNFFKYFAANFNKLGLKKRFFGEFRGTGQSFLGRWRRRLPGWTHSPRTMPGCWASMTPGESMLLTFGSTSGESKSA